LLGKELAFEAVRRRPLARRCSGWFRLSAVRGLGYPCRRIELPHPSSEDGVKPLQSIAEPLVLPLPVTLVPRVRRFEDQHDVAFYLPRALLPVELLPNSFSISSFSS
jgi:hypothetical protein